MNTKQKQILAVAGGVAVAITAALLKWSAMPNHPHPVMHDDLELVSALLGALGFAVPVSFFGAGSSAPDPDARTKQGTGSIGVLLPLVLVALAMSGCATAGGKALGACELGQLGTEGQIGLATAQQIAGNPSSTTADLESAALQLLPGQLECGAKALLAWLESLSQPAAPASSVKGKLSAHALLSAGPNDHAIGVLKAYLAAHPAACGVRQAM